MDLAGAYHKRSDVADALARAVDRLRKTQIPRSARSRSTPHVRPHGNDSHRRRRSGHVWRTGSKSVHRAIECTHLGNEIRSDTPSRHGSSQRADSAIDAQNHPEGYANPMADPANQPGDQPRCSSFAPATCTTVHLGQTNKIARQSETHRLTDESKHLHLWTLGELSTPERPGQGPRTAPREAPQP
jgi:hypothetical protein